MSIASLIKLILIGAGMFFYYKTIEEENGLYISVPIIGIAAMLLGLALSLDPVSENIFLYFSLAFMAQTEPIISISFFVINLLAELGGRFGFLNPFIPLIVFIISTSAFYALQYVDVDFVFALFKFFLVTVVFLIIWYFLRPIVFIFFYHNLPHFLI